MGRRDSRFPVMPVEMLGWPTIPEKPRWQDKSRPRNGPAIEEWEQALLGRERIKEDAADAVSDKSLRATLKICVKKADGRAFGRLPLEVILQIEQLLHDTVSVHLVCACDGSS